MNDSPTQPLPPVSILGLGLPGEPGAREATPPPGVEDLLREADVIIGGKALLAALPKLKAEKIPVGADTNALYQGIAAARAEGKRQVVLCSGDPLYFGLGARLSSALGPEALRIVPGLSTVQCAAALLGFPWEQAGSVSLHGRLSMLPLAHALIRGGPVFILTDALRPYPAIAAWMLDRGCAGYVIHVLVDLYRKDTGEIAAGEHRRYPVEEAARHRTPEAWGTRAVLFLEPSGPEPSRLFGLPDQDIERARNIVTKAPVRAASLAALGIEPFHTVWDLGAGSGAVSIEAARLAWRGQVFAVERKADRAAIIRANRQTFAAPNLEIVEGDMPGCLPGGGAGGDALPRPDRIFVGGGLSGSCAAAAQIINRAWDALKPGGRLVADCVLLSSLEGARAALMALDAGVSVSCLHASASAPLANDLRLEALNPVFMVLGEKRLEGRANKDKDAQAPATGEAKENA
jgi:precorrin-6Y C5,15-methyltransferase (decarboxylating)